MRVIALSLGAARNCSARRRVEGIACAAVVLSLLAAASCKKPRYIDTKPLDKAGMDFSSEETVKALNPSDAEIAEIAKAKMGGLSDKTCIELFKIARTQGQTDWADPADGMVQAGMTEDEIIELAKMKQLGLGYGDLQAMRLTGLSDLVVMEVARRHAAGKQALSGVSLARLKDTGLSQTALFELVHRGIRDDQVAGIVALRRHKTPESEILKKYPAVDVTPPQVSTTSSPTQ
jgi:hypothetical protein